MATKKAKPPAKAKESGRTRIAIIEAISSVTNNLIRFGGLVLIALFVYRSIAVLAGETTTANIGINFLADIRISEALAWLFGGGGVMYGLRQRKLRRDTIERLAPRNAELEKLIDPNRSSSRLTPRGETNPRDEL